MQRLPYIIRCSLFFISILILLPLDLGISAQQEVKDKKPADEVLETGNTTPPEEKDKGYLYDPTGKTDPFKSFIAVREEKEAEEKKKPKTYLETLELSQLDVIIIVISPEGKWAMVKDSKGVGHVIKEGTPIGTNNGVVYRISPGEVVIREEYRDFRGRTQFREIEKKTPSSD